MKKTHYLNRKELTAADVAARVGVSARAVSAVVSGSGGSAGRVADSTRKKILTVSKKMGYAPNMNARGLRQKKSFLAGVLFNEADHDLLHDFQAGLQEVLTPMNYAPLLLTHRNAEQEQKNYNLCRSRGVDGLLIDPTIDPLTGQACISYADSAAGMPVIQIFTEHPTGFPSIVWDMRAAGALAAQYLLSLGHTRIALLTHDRYVLGRNSAMHRDAWLHAEGYREVMKEAAGVTTIVTFKMPHELDHWTWIEAGEHRLDALLGQHPDVTAIICYSDWEAIGLLRGLAARRNQNVVTPSVIGRGNLPLGRIWTPSLTTLQIDAEEGGRLAGTLLLDKLNGKSARSTYLHPQIIIRNSANTPSNE